MKKIFITFFVFLSLNGFTKTVEIQNPITPVNLVKTVDGWTASAVHYSASIVAGGTATIEQDGVISQFYDELFFGNNVAGIITWISLDSPQDAMPEVRNGNEIWWTDRWTNIDYVLRFTEEKIEKFIYLSAPAKNILPSPTSAEYFPGAEEDNLIFGLGSRYLQELNGSVLQMDDINIDPDSDQVIGNRIVVSNGKEQLFIVSPPQYDAELVKGYQCYLGDYDRLINCFPWVTAKNSTWFDPSYTFQDNTYLKDSMTNQGASSTSYGTDTPLWVRYQAGADIYSYFDFDLPSIAIVCGISSTSSAVEGLTDFSLSFTSNGTTIGTPGSSVTVDRMCPPLAGMSNLTWDNQSSSYETLYTQYVSWASGTVNSTNSTYLLAAAKAAIVAGTHLQVRMRRDSSWTDNGSSAQFHAVDFGAVVSRPKLSITFDPNILYNDSLSSAWINDSTVYIAYPYSAAVTSALKIAFVDADSGLISAGTSSMSFGYPDDTHTISQICLPASVSGQSRVGLYWKNSAGSDSGVIALENLSSSGSGSTLSATDVFEGYRTRGGETAAEALDRIRGVTESQNNNKTAIQESIESEITATAAIIEAASDWIKEELAALSASVAAASAYVGQVSAVTGTWVDDLKTRMNSAIQVAAASQPLDVTAYAVSGAHIERTDGGWTGKVLGPRDAYVGDVSHLVRYMPIGVVESGELEWKFQGLVFDWAHDATPAYVQRKIGTPFFDTFTELETYIEDEGRPSGSGAAFSTATPSF